MTSNEPPILTVTELTQQIKGTLEPAFRSIWLQGEVSNFKKQSSGHLYFSLKDSYSQISAVMFRSYAEKLKTQPKEGDQILVHGEINLYAPRGSYQIQIDEIRLTGLGELLLKLEELKREIQKRGWFRKEHKKPIPPLPRKIGVVTSPTGAAIQDMLHVLTRRVFDFHLILNPVRVQGESAAFEIAQAIKQFNDFNLVDVIIIARGGGSIEDLWAFNEEIVAEAVFNSRIPIICAVGHETDHCIADYVADLRAPTPSAAAEIVMGEKAQQIERLSQLKRRYQQTMHHLLKQARAQLNTLWRQPFFSQPYALIGNYIQSLDSLKIESEKCIRQHLRLIYLRLQGIGKQLLSLQPSAQLKANRQKLHQIEMRLTMLIRHKIDRSTQILKRVNESLHLVNPKNVLQKGYSILFSQDGNVVRSVHQLKTGSEIRALVSDGEVKAVINSIKEKQS